MKTLSDIVKTGSQKMTVDDLKLCIKQESYLETLSDLLSPLNPSVFLAEIWLVPGHTLTHTQSVNEIKQSPALTDAPHQYTRTSGGQGLGS